MRKDSALQVLPSFRLQYHDANRIFAILSVFVILINLYLLSQSDSWVIALLMSATLLICILSIIAYWRYLPVLLKSNSGAIFYVGATVEFVGVLIGIIPLCLYLFVEQNWILLNKYGIKCLFLFNNYENWLLPASVFLMISCTYWLIIYLIRKESKLFYHLEKKKKELNE